MKNKISEFLGIGFGVLALVCVALAIVFVTSSPPANATTPTRHPSELNKRIHVAPNLDKIVDRENGVVCYIHTVSGQLSCVRMP